MNHIKNDSNPGKHGFSLQDASGLEWGIAVVWPDTRRNYDEARMAALRYTGLRIMDVVFAGRPLAQPTERRIISLQKANSQQPTANNRELKRYADI